MGQNFSMGFDIHDLFNKYNLRKSCEHDREWL